MRPIRLTRFVLLAAAAGACRTGAASFPAGQVTPAPATVPPRLIAESAAPLSGVAPAESKAACRNPMFDPTDNAPLQLTGSGLVEGVLQGDYVVPEGHYGLPSGSRLRVDCATGRVLGVVRH